MAVTITWTDVVDVAAELATGVADTAKVKILAMVNRRVSERAFPDDETMVEAKSYLAAHFGLLTKQGSHGVGAVSSKSEGGASISYSPMFSPSDQALGSTIYGQTFLALVQVSPAARAGLVLGVS